MGYNRESHAHHGSYRIALGEGMALSNTTHPQTEADLLEQVPLLGRKSELRQFLKALTLCRSGQGKAIYLTGNEGIGKTALLETFLQLAVDHYQCRALSFTLPPQASPHLFFVQLLEEIMGLANQILQKALNQSNAILKTLDLHWNKNDLIQIVALTRLQESMGSTNQFALEQLSNAIFQSIPMFKRMNPAIRTQVDALSQVLFDPWVTLGVSLVNPMNPHVQNAKAMARQILGEDSTPLLSTSAYPMPLLSGGKTDSGPLAETGAHPTEPLHESEEGALETGVDLPAATTLQTALKDLLTFINSGLKGHNAALIIAVDQWETLMDSPEATRRELQDMLRDVLSQTVDQRDSRLMVILSSRSEAESYALGSSLFNTLKVKYLVSPLAVAAQQRFINDRMKATGIECEPVVVQGLLALCQGNPAWLELFTAMIVADLQQLGIKCLDEELYQERYAVKHPADLLDIVFARLQLGFVGEEDHLIKVLGNLTRAFGYQPFTFAQAAQTLRVKSNHEAFLNRALQTLVTHHCLIPMEQETGMHRFYGPFILEFLKSKSLPVQEDLPTPDKLSSLKKILPLAIQSGDLTREKTQEILAMASALESPDLFQFVEQTLIEALAQPDVAEATQMAILDSLPLLWTTTAVETLLHALSSPSAAIREAACQHLTSCVNQPGLPIPRKTLIQAVIPLTGDPVAQVRLEAYQLLAKCATEKSIILPVLLEGAKLSDPAIQAICLSGLAHCRANTPEAKQIYQGFLRPAMDMLLFKTALRGLQSLEKETLLPILTAYLEREPVTPHWTEVLMTLMHLDLVKALPWLTTCLSQGDESELKLFILKRLGSKAHPDAENILIQFLQPAEGSILALELRWMAMRSLGWIGRTQAALDVLEAQFSACQSDDILEQTRKTALKQIAERLPGSNTSIGESETIQASAVYAPANGNGSHTEDEVDSTIELVAVTAIES